MKETVLLVNSAAGNKIASEKLLAEISRAERWSLALCMGVASIPLFIYIVCGFFIFGFYEPGDIQGWGPYFLYPLLLTIPTFLMPNIASWFGDFLVARAVIEADRSCCAPPTAL